MQTVRQREILSRAATNDPQSARATYHREPEWIEGPESDPETFVAWALRIAVIGLVILALSERYGVDLIAGVL